jgi:uncharacterized protein (DUF1810 family)
VNGGEWTFTSEDFAYLVWRILGKRGEDSEYLLRRIMGKRGRRAEGEIKGQSRP